MIRHIVSWNYKQGLTELENKENAIKIKNMLESLKDCVDGIIELKVCINTMPSSTKDVVLNSLFKDEYCLEKYQVHPEHKKAGEFVATALQDRVCVDYKE